MSTVPDFIQRIQNALNGVKAGADCDVLLYNGPIDRSGFQEVCRHEPTKEKLLLILTTSGGDPHAAFRIARILGDRYKRIEALIGAPCKSAGTLVAMGADMLIMANEGELGPLDIQLRRPDEPLEAESGLDVVTSLRHLTANALGAWESAFLEIQGDSQLSTKACADLANGLVAELYGRLFAQVDPVRLGAVVRANTIATRYGTELAELRKNLKTNAVRDLVTNYPAHGYAIDRREAEKLFINVRAPTPEERILLKEFDQAVTDVKRFEKDRIISRLDTLLAMSQTEDDVSEQDRSAAPRGDAPGTAGSGSPGSTNGSVPATDKPGAAGGGAAALFAKP